MIQNFFDRTSIHPQSYKLAFDVCEYLRIDLEKYRQVNLDGCKYWGAS